MVTKDPNDIVCREAVVAEVLDHDLVLLVERRHGGEEELEDNNNTSKGCEETVYNDTLPKKATTAA